MNYEYWYHTRSGEVWAVEIDDDGIVHQASGPLYYHDYERLGPWEYDMNAEEGEQIRNHVDEYVRVEQIGY